MKKLYEKPEFEIVKLSLNNVMVSSEAEGAGGGGDSGGSGDFGDGNFS